jgi:CRP/FNR family cyclic AMP-dependent transcriptional regulator
MNVAAFLESAGVAKALVQYGRGDPIFHQGDRCEHVWYIASGDVKLSVLSRAGKEGVVAMLGAGDFLGEGCLAGQPSQTRSATAMTASAIAVIDKRTMVQLLHAQRAMSDRFIAHILARNLRIEEDLIDHLFNSSEKRLARTLLLLARHGTPSAPDHIVLKISQATLAEMIGTTRSRVNGFLNKFKKLGCIEYGGQRPLTIKTASLTVMLRE